MRRQLSHQDTAAGLGLDAAVHASPAVCGVLAGVTAVGALIPDID